MNMNFDYLEEKRTHALLGLTMSFLILLLYVSEVGSEAFDTKYMFELMVFVIISIFVAYFLLSSLLIQNEINKIKNTPELHANGKSHF